MNDSIENKLSQLGIALPGASEPAAKYANFVITSNLLFVSGKGPSGKPKGKLGREFTTDEGYQFARQAALEVLAVVKEAVGNLENVVRVVRVQGFVNATPEFEEHHRVLNGYSDLMIDIFGEKGFHVRSVLGANSLRDNLPVIVESVFEIRLEGGNTNDSY